MANIIRPIFVRSTVHTYSIIDMNMNTGKIIDFKFVHKG